MRNANIKGFLQFRTGSNKVLPQTENTFNFDLASLIFQFLFQTFSAEFKSALAARLVNIYSYTANQIHLYKWNQ